MKQLLCILSYIFFFTLTSFYPDTFRVRTVQTCSIEEDVFAPFSLTLGCNDAVCFTVKSDCIFLEGLELEIKQNKTSMDYPNAIAYSVYTNIVPAPSKEQIDYTAQKVKTSLLPNRYSHSIRIPIKDKHSLTHIRNSELIPYHRAITTAPFMLRFIPIMKGLPETLEHAALTVIARPLLIAEGGLKIKLAFPDTEQKPVTVRLNNDYLADFNTVQLLTPGTYAVTVSSDAYRTEVRSCIIERGKITQLDVQLTSITPLLHIKAPENVVILLDDRVIPLSKEPIPVEPGAHLVIFKMGSYELTRQISVEEGKTYELTMTMDVLLQELPQ